MNDQEKTGSGPAKALSLKGLNKQIQDQAVDTDERLASLEESASVQQESLGEILASIKAMSRPDHTNRKDSRDVDYNEFNRSGEFGQGANGEFELAKTGLSVNDPEFKEKADQVLFDKEMVEVLVMPSTEKFPDKTFTLGVNGRTIMIVRGAKQWIPRMYVEVMAMAKISTFGNEEYRNDQNEMSVRNPETRSQRYPFQITTERNPKGAQWFERVMNQAA
jgi:hypothetical protein